ncbi:DUF1707 domain-containing protein [Phytomonospora sp. NPDC050363]|uniref:DUF1707 SHOCT-like domain-containing protein n=1 Tax=Phytomonospora sp. NPDC050363 TaxID=3155642 RepID=UPI0033D42B60
MPHRPSRIGDPERAHARRVLDEAYRSGYLGEDEYHARLDLLQAAIWDTDLADVIGDLGLVGDPAQQAAGYGSPAYGEPVQRIDQRFHYSERQPIARRISEGVGAVWSVIGLVALVAVVWFCCAAVNDL